MCKICQSTHHRTTNCPLIVRAGVVVAGAGPVAAHPFGGVPVMHGGAVRVVGPMPFGGVPVMHGGAVRVVGPMPFGGIPVMHGGLPVMHGGAVRVVGAMPFGGMAVMHGGPIRYESFYGSTFAGRHA